MYIEAIILGLIIGFVRNGRLNNFYEAHFKGWILAFLAFLLFLVPYGIKILDIPFEQLALIPYISMCLIALVALFNFERNGMKIILVGLALNLLIMGLNGYRMPVDAVAMEAMGHVSFVESLTNGSIVNYMTLDGAHALSPFLGKIITLPKAYPLTEILSIGDIIVSIGIVVLIQYEMLLSAVKSRGSMLQFTYNSRLRR